MPRKSEHFVHRSNWLRAAVLGANDGIVSTASLVVGVATAELAHTAVIVAGMAGLVAGAFSMAAGEYVSVSSQADTEKADLDREREGLQANGEEELAELEAIYVNRGLDQDLAKKVAIQLTEHDALEAHARDELGISTASGADPIQAAFASAVAFAIGGALPILAALISPISWVAWVVSVSSLISLGSLGWVSASLGGSPPLVAVIRITVWGTIAMAATAATGYLFGVTV